MTDKARTERPRKTSTRDGLFQKNGFWWLDWYDAEGKRHRKKAAPDYSTAKLMYRDLKTAIAKGEVLGVREEGTHLRDFVEKKYWPAVASTLAPEWAERSRGILDATILPTFGDARLSSLRQEAIERWYGERRGQVKASTANKELARLKHLLGRAIAWGYAKANPAAKVRKAKEPSGRIRYLTPDERRALLEGADVGVKAKDGRTWTMHQGPTPALRLYIVAALHTGGRRGDLVRLRWVDVDMKRKSITFRETKNGRDRTIPMTETLRRELQTLPRPLDAAEHVLPRYGDPRALTRSFTRLAQRLGLVGLTFHDLRHDAASNLTMAGVPQRTIMEILGHRDPRMTVRYQHLAPGHLSDAMQSLDRAASAPPESGTGAIADAQ